jgi:hypothetical protein
MFSCITQARLQIVNMPSWMVLLDVSYIYIKMQVSIIGLMLPKKKLQITLRPWMGSRKGKGWGGYTFASMPINKQQLITVDIKATI